VSAFFWLERFDWRNGFYGANGLGCFSCWGLRLGQQLQGFLSPLCLLSFPFLLNGGGCAFPCGAKLVQFQLLWSLGFDEFVDPHIFIYEQIEIEGTRSRLFAK
jgi:hypothetical protein